MQTKAGVVQLKQTMVKEYGSIEAYREEMARRGSKGGKVKVLKGIAKLKVTDPEAYAQAQQRAYQKRWGKRK